MIHISMVKSRVWIVFVVFAALAGQTSAGSGNYCLCKKFSAVGNLTTDRGIQCFNQGGFAHLKLQSLSSKSAHTQYSFVTNIAMLGRKFLKHYDRSLQRSKRLGPASDALVCDQAALTKASAQLRQHS